MWADDWFNVSLLGSGGLFPRFTQFCHAPHPHSFCCFVLACDDAPEVPLAFLMMPKNHKRKSRNWNGLTINLYAMPFGQRKHLGSDRSYHS
jgi:hypothetical protein